MSGLLAYVNSETFSEVWNLSPASSRLFLSERSLSCHRCKGYLSCSAAIYSIQIKLQSHGARPPSRLSTALLYRAYLQAKQQASFRFTIKRIKNSTKWCIRGPVMLFSCLYWNRNRKWWNKRNNDTKEAFKVFTFCVLLVLRQTSIKNKRRNLREPPCLRLYSGAFIRWPQSAGVEG